jgi:hypothetical protein
MTNETVFQVIRDAIANAPVKSVDTGAPDAPRGPVHEDEAEQYARAVLVALDHNGFKIIQAKEEPDVD